MSESGARLAPRDDYSRRTAWLILAGLIATSLVSKLFYNMGIIVSDDARYLTFFHHYARLEPFTELDHAASRLFFLMPTGLLGDLLGDAIEGPGRATALFYQVQLILVYMVASRITGLRRAGIVTACLLLLSPRELQGIGFLPDTLLTAYVTLSLYSFARATLSHEDGAARRLALVGAGIFAALAYSAKEPGILLLPFMGVTVALHWRHRPLEVARQGAFLALGFATVVLVEWSILYHYTGDFLYKPHSLANHNGPYLAEFSWDNLLAQAETQASYLWLRSSAGVGITMWLGIVAAVLLWRPSTRLAPAFFVSARGRQVLRIFLAWGVFAGLFLTFGSSSLRPYLFPPLQPRYLSVFLFPFTIAAGCLLALLPLTRVRRGILLAGVFTLHIVLGSSGAFVQAGNPHRTVQCLLEHFDDPSIRPMAQSRTATYLELSASPLAHQPDNAPLPTFLLTQQIDYSDFRDSFAQDGARLRYAGHNYRRVYAIHGAPLAGILGQTCATGVPETVIRLFSSRRWRLLIDRFRAYELVDE